MKRKTKTSSGERKLTPMFQQYFAVKEAHPDAIVFFRMGDFFEIFHEDAVLASRLLEITLTARGPKGGSEPPIPMCGVPAHAVDGYVARLVKLGYRVAMCDQVEDPKKTKGLVRREVTRIATPGTHADSRTLEANENLFLAAIIERGDRVGIGFSDLSTGRIEVTEVPLDLASARVRDEIARQRPREVLIPSEHLDALLPEDIEITLTRRSPEESSPEQAIMHLERHLGVSSLSGFGLDGKTAATAAAGLLFDYMRETQRGSLAHLRAISYVDHESHLALDAASLRNLEVIHSLRDGSSRDTLFAVVDETRTPMGARRLRQRLLRPSRNLDETVARLDAVSELVRDPLVRSRIREDALGGIHDLERLLSRVTLRQANARDLLALRDSIRLLPLLRELTAEIPGKLTSALAKEIDELPDVADLLARAIADDAPASLRDGGLIKAGYDEELDELRTIASDGRSWIAAYEGRQRQETGIASLRVRFNRVFGYSIEVTKANLKSVPESYERRQTLANAERYTTTELKEYETKVLDADERLTDLELAAFEQVREQVAGEAGRIARTAAAVAEIDLHAGFAEVAAALGWCRPEMSESGSIVIEGGRHPVVEAGLVGDRFVPNDLDLGGDERQVLLVTGPNMGGKSTYLRQTALSVILAQSGSFVPATSARLPIVDRVFTRVGASDDLARGRSTFMVEMIETANILHNATGASLVVLDEVGRGTSTFDGLSLAWAIVEHLHDHPRGRPRVLFATHYHELTDLANILDRVTNVRVAVKEHQGKIVFLRKIEDGRSDRSYGIEVARLAGLPREVVDRARQVLKDLETIELGLEARLRPKSTPPPSQLTLFVPATHPVLDDLKRIDAESLTPIEALAKLDELARRARKEL